MDQEGWFNTGDVATIDNNGFMQITDRQKDVIKSGGEPHRLPCPSGPAVGDLCDPLHCLCLGQMTKVTCLVARILNPAHQQMMQIPCCLSAFRCCPTSYSSYACLVFHLDMQHDLVHAGEWVSSIEIENAASAHEQVSLCRLSADSQCVACLQVSRLAYCRFQTDHVPMFMSCIMALPIAVQKISVTAPQPCF